jgi:hypothetical protein
VNKLTSLSLSQFMFSVPFKNIYCYFRLLPIPVANQYSNKFSLYSLATIELILALFSKFIHYLISILHLTLRLLTFLQSDETRIYLLPYIYIYVCVF